jgi:uncharacterized protein (UPF0276 family)
MALPSDVGIGLKTAYLDAVLGAAAGTLGFVEVHAENYLVDGGPFHRHLSAVRERLPLSLHGVSLSLGGAQDLDSAHLAALRQLIQCYQPAQFSEHLAWSTHDGHYLPDLLPLAYNDATLARVCAHVDRAQEALGVRLQLENPATYVAFEASEHAEADFLSALVRRTGCGLLLDVSNAVVSCTNHQRDLYRYLRALPLHAVGQIHLAGFAREADSTGAALLIDSHDAPIDDAVWAAYAWVLRHTGAVATLIERDQHLPTFHTLLQEVQTARTCLAAR